MMQSIDRSQTADLVAFLEANRRQMIDFLSGLVLAESPSTSPEAQAAPFMLLLEALEALGFAVQIVPGQTSGGCLLAVPGAVNESHPRQLLVGHCDTVWPLGTLKRMPFVVEGNIVRGPGVYDMKAGLTQMIFALRAIKAIGAIPPLAPVVLINSDEEIGSQESLPIIELQARQARRAFILEPALGLAGQLKTARKGVGYFEIVVRGRAAHAGLEPERGVSAILALSYIIQQLFDLNDVNRGVSVNVGRIEGGMRANVVAPECRAEVDVRVPTEEDAGRMEATIRALAPPIPGIELEIRGQFGRPPLERTPANQALWRRAREVGRRLGLSLDQGSAGGGSDGNYTSQFTATLDGLGAVGDGAHAEHEYVFIDKMIERAALLALLVLMP